LFGGPDAEHHAADWRERIGPALATPLAVTTELGKVWELAAYGVNIAIEKAVWDACEEWGADWSVAYQAMVDTYNAGQQHLGLSHFTRPLLQHMPGPIGGHCVRENMSLIDHPIARIVEAT
jgi:hypothetical protein